MLASHTKLSVVKKLTSIFWRALKDNKWSVALQAAKLQGQCIGMFQKQRFPEVTRLSDMTEEQLRDFIDALERLDPELKNLEAVPVTELLTQDPVSHSSHSEAMPPPPP